MKRTNLNIIVSYELIHSGTEPPKPESKKHRDPRKQDPEEGFKSEEGENLIKSFIFQHLMIIYSKNDPFNNCIYD